MKNPAIFMLERTGMTRPEFAKKHELGRNLLLRLSQGRVRNITPRIEAALWKEWSDRGISQDEFDEVYNTLDLDSAYQRWMHNKRLVNKTKLPSNLTGPKGSSPFGKFVSTIGSVSKTAQVLVVPDVVVQRYADGRQREMPLAIKEALAEMKYPHTAELEAAQERWHGA